MIYYGPFGFPFRVYNEKSLISFYQIVRYRVISELTVA